MLADKTPFKMSTFTRVVQTALVSYKITLKQNFNLFEIKIKKDELFVYSQKCLPSFHSLTLDHSLPLVSYLIVISVAFVNYQISY